MFGATGNTPRSMKKLPKLKVFVADWSVLSGEVNGVVDDGVNEDRYGVDGVNGSLNAVNGGVNDVGSVDGDDGVHDGLNGVK